MKTWMIAAIAVAAGLLLGSAAGGLRASSEIVEAAQDSIAQAEAASIARLEADSIEHAQVDPTAGAGEDSTAAAHAVADGSNDHGPAQDEHPVQAAATTDAELPATDMGLPSTGGAPVVDATNAAPDDGEDERDAGARRLAKIFAVMDAGEAASVLRQLSDEEIEAVLRRMSERNAAPILEAFPPERAAALSRVLLTPGGPSS